MEKLRAGLEFIFSSYKRTAAILFIAALALAIPITVTLVGQQQDIRQRAQVPLCRFDYQCPAGQKCIRGVCTTSTTPSPISRFTPTPTSSSRISPTPTRSTPTPTPICPPEAEACPPPWLTPTPIRTTPTPTSSSRISPTPTRSTLTPTPTQTVPTLTIIPTATPTVPSNQTQIALSLLVTGIGSDVSKGQNANPKNAQRAADVKVFNSQNQEIASIKGSVVYNRANGNYEGRIALGSSVASGSYTVKVRLDNTLWKTIPGIQVLTAGALTQTPTTALVSGDINQDNEINLLDYTLLLTCIQNPSCSNALLSKEDVNSFVYAVKNRILIRNGD